MKSNKSKLSCKQGFTLIELLVVVLIIGILAAVAVPQYKLAVVKSRVASILPILQTIVRADAVYFLANGVYSPSVHKLDVSMPGECNDIGGGDEKGQVWKCGKDFVIDNSGGHQVIASYCPGYTDTFQTCSNKREFRIMMNAEHNYEFFCGSANNSVLGQKICKTLTRH